ncbi:MAG: hypothetical protein SGCHY_001407 [Lobulomycetales sp.]
MASARRAQRRNLMDYYSVPESEKHTVKENAVDPLATRPSDPLDLDSPAFSCVRYLEKLLGEVSLAELVQRDNDLVTEIRTLDGDKKTLVYENYSKFISVSDTIGEMRSKVEAMNAQVGKLTAKLNVVDNSSSDTIASLSANRDRIAELSGAHTLLKSMSSISELPNQLKLHSQNHNYAEAVYLYRTTIPLLLKYGQMPMFKRISAEAENLMNSIKQLILEDFDSSDSSIALIGSSAGLLLSLSHLPANDLGRLYLHRVKLKIDRLISGIHEDIDCPQVASLTEAADGVNNATMDTIEKLNNLITDLDAVVGTFKLHFCIVSDSAESEDDPDTLDETTASTDALKMISGYASKILETFFSLLKRLLSLPSDPNEMERFSPATLCASLSSIKKDCSKATALSDIYPMQLSGFLENFLEETIDKLLEIPFHEFSATLESLTEASDLCAESAKVANMVLHTLTNDCVDYFCSFLEWDVSRLLSVDFAAKVSDGLDSFWSKLFDFVRKSSMLNRPSIASHAPATMIILLKAHVVSSLSHLSIENVYQAYKKKALSSAIDATKIRGFAQEAQDCASTFGRSVTVD